jgi:hypothetical protein
MPAGPATEMLTTTSAETPSGLRGTRGRNEDEATGSLDPGPQATRAADQSDDLTRAFVRLSNLPTYPLDRLSRYEATLWRQTCQILFTLRCLNQSRPWERLRLR